MKDRPSIEQLHELFELNEETGELRWRVSPAQCVKAGDMAGTTCRSRRTFYRHIGIDGVLYKAHMIVWAMTHNEWPERGVDHEDHNGLHNWPSNSGCNWHTKPRQPTAEGEHSFQRGLLGGTRTKMASFHRVQPVSYLPRPLHRRNSCRRTYDTAALLVFGEFAYTNAQAFGWEYEPIELSLRAIAKIEAARANTSRLKLLPLTKGSQHDPTVESNTGRCVKYRWKYKDCHRRFIKQNANEAARDYANDPAFLEV